MGRKSQLTSEKQSMPTVQSDRLLSVRSLLERLDVSCLRLDDENHFLPHSDHRPNVFGMASEFLNGRRISDLMISEEFKTKLISSIAKARKSDSVQLVTFGQFVAALLSYGSEVHLFSLSTKDVNTFKNWYHDGERTVFVCKKTGTVILRYVSNEVCFRDAKQVENILDLFQEPERDLIRSTIERSLFDKKELLLEFTLNTTSGQEWVRGRFCPNAEAKLVRIEFEKITERKQEKIKVEQAIKQSQLVLNSLENGIIMADEDGKILMQNSQATIMFMGKFDHLLDLAHRSAGRWFKMDGKTPVNSFELPFVGVQSKESNDLEYEFMFESVTEGVFPIRIKKASEITPSDDARNTVWTFTNLAFEYDSQKKLEEANASLDHFVRATAHDLKSPITNMINLFNLRDRMNDPEKDEMIFSKIRKSIGQLDDLLGGLMEMVDARSNMEVSIEELQFEDVLQFVEEECQQEIRMKDARITAEFGVESIIYNKAYLRSIFQNLITNALKYSREEVIPAIHIETSQHQDAILLKVSDNGIGIDLEKFEKHLFKPFKRLSSKGSGKGIGLTLIKNIVEKNGGEVFVESEPGKGTTFAFLLVPYRGGSIQPSLF